MERTRKQLTALAVAIVIVLSSSAVFGEPPVRPVLPAGTEIRVPSATPYTLDVESMLITREDADAINLTFRLVPVLERKVEACNQTVLGLTGSAGGSWLRAAKWALTGAALVLAFVAGAVLQ